MRNRRLRRSFFAVIAACSIALCSQNLFSTNADATLKVFNGTSANSNTGPTDDEVLVWMSMANFAKSELSKLVKATRDKGAPKVTELLATKTRIEEEQKAAIVTLVASCVSAGAAFGMGASGGSAATGASTSVAAITRLEKLRTLEDSAKTDLQALLPLFQEIQDAEKVSPILTRISQDKDYAAKFITAAHNNLTNPGTLGQLLQTDSPGSTVEVREVKEGNGLTVVFRVGKLTHCLSTNQQCNAQPYSVTR
jgi:hypothetical protein